MSQSSISESASGIVGALLWAIAIVGFQSLLWIAWFIIVLKCLPYLEPAIMESDALMPIMSQQLFLTSRAMHMYWYLLVLVGVPLALGEIAVVVGARKTANTALKGLRYACVALFSLVPLMLLLYFLVALALTIRMLHEVVPA